VHLDRLDTINREAMALQELPHGSTGGDDAELTRALQKLGQPLRELRGEWEQPPHKPVTQQTMGAGTTELF